MPDDPQYGLRYDPYGFPMLPPPGQRPEQPSKKLARSVNFDVAVRELRAYLEERVGGRSCLIAGARGSGKTTLIDRVCYEVALDRSSRYRLMVVRLHGPSLLSPPPPVPTKDDPTPAKISIAEHALKTLVINLYQTAAEEIARAFQAYVLFRGNESNRRDEWNEFAAQLRLTLDGAPSAATLRFFWDRAGALREGVLFPDSPHRDDEFTSGGGPAEIVALATAAEAYQRCSGQYRQEKKDEKAAGEKAEAKTEVTASGKELSKALIGVASGVAAGATVAALGQSKEAMALAGAITALLSTVTLNYSSTRSRESTVKEEITFLPDTKPSALVHRMLLLLDRLRQARLVPVFIIDELDKVASPIALNELTTHMKFLFADRAFFCFLTDRTYFAEIGRLNRQRANTQLRTIYTTQMLVRYDTSSVRDFLKIVIRPEGRVDDKTRRELEADAEAFRFILLCRSRMLLFDLSSDLTNFSGDDGQLKLALGEPRRSLGHQLHLAIQLAIELVLINEFVANRISRDANFAQSIYDALYYPVNLWYADEREVDCTPDTLTDGISDRTGEDLNLEASDKEFLHTQVKRMLDLVADLPRLEEELRTAFRSKRLVVADEIAGRLLNAIPKEIQLLKPLEENKYQWNYNRSGIPFKASVIQDIRDDLRLRVGYAIIELLEKSMAEIVSKPPTVEEIIPGLLAAESVIDLLAHLYVPIGDAS